MSQAKQWLTDEQLVEIFKKNLEHIQEIKEEYDAREQYAHWEYLLIDVANALKEDYGNSFDREQFYKDCGLNI